MWSFFIKLNRIDLKSRFHQIIFFAIRLRISNFILMFNVIIIIYLIVHQLIKLFIDISQKNNLTQDDELTRRKFLIICTLYCYWERVSIMSTSTKRRDVVSKTSFITSRMNLQSRKMQMQNDIEKLLSDKFSETINDSTALRLLRAMIQLLSLLFTRKKNMRQKLININKKLERIESNIFKTKTNIEIYAIAIKIEDLTNFDVTTTTRRSLNVSTT